MSAVQCDATLAGNVHEDEAFSVGGRAEDVVWRCSAASCRASSCTSSAKAFSLFAFFTHEIRAMAMGR
ncbi:hypothetical protein AV944_09760 [Sphingomonas sp. LK11]|nr:hypothetical protein AV944_09760 [Sphingomonas sp. LK11]